MEKLMPSQKFTDEILVAFADDELDAKTSNQISEAIKSDEKLKQRVDSFRQTATLLKERLGVSNEVAPEHIKIRIQEIEKKILSNKLTANTQKSNFLGRTFSSFKTTANDFLSSHTIGGFAAGASFALMIAYIAPFNLIQTKTGFSPEIEPQIIMRGPEKTQLVSMLVEQNGVRIPLDGILEANAEFTISIVSPLEGDYKLFEKNNDEKNIIVSGKAIKGEMIKIPRLEVFGQAELNIFLEIYNENLKVEASANFVVSEKLQD